MGESVKILYCATTWIEGQSRTTLPPVSELIEEHTWQSLILYDMHNEYRKLQHHHGFRWGSDSQHLHTRFLQKQQGTLSRHASSARKRTSKPSTEAPICKVYNSPAGCYWPRCKFQHICIAPGCGKKHPDFTHCYGLAHTLLPHNLTKYDSFSSLSIKNWRLDQRIATRLRRRLPTRRSYELI